MTNARSRNRRVLITSGLAAGVFALLTTSVGTANAMPGPGGSSYDCSLAYGSANYICSEHSDSILAYSFGTPALHCPPGLAYAQRLQCLADLRDI